MNDWSLPSTPALQQPELGGIRVVVVDDDADAREVVEKILRNQGARVVSAESAAQAYALLSAERPDLRVSDVAMPNEDGLAFWGECAAIQIPVLLRSPHLH